MTKRAVIGAVVGAAIGLGVGTMGARSGGTCPFTCNPWVATCLGALFGGMIAWGGGAPADETLPEDDADEDADQT